MLRRYLSNASFLKAIANAGLFQVGWWVCILAPLEWAVATVVAYLFIHAKWLLPSNTWKHIVRIVVIGCAIDSFLAFSGVLNLGDQRAVIPLWLVAIWIMFAPCFFLSLRFLHKQPFVAGAFGAVGGAFAYFGGATIRPDISLGEPLLQSILILALVWAAFIPLIFSYIEKDGLLVNKGQ